jgi:hypothetical protein
MEGTSSTHLQIQESNTDRVKDAAQFIIYSDILWPIRYLETLARTLRDTALDGRDFGRHINSFHMQHHLPNDRFVILGHAYGGILARARNLSSLSVLDSNLSLLALTTIDQTHAGCLKYLTLATCESTCPDILSYIGHFADLSSLTLDLDSNFTAAFADVPSLTWNLPKLLHLDIDCQTEPYVSVLARLLGNSNFCMLREMNLRMHVNLSAEADLTWKASTLSGSSYTALCKRFA